MRCHLTARLALFASACGLIGTVSACSATTTGGTTEGATTTSGTADDGTTTSGTADGGTTTSGTADGGTTTSGTADGGTISLGGAYIRQYQQYSVNGNAISLTTSLMQVLAGSTIVVFATEEGSGNDSVPPGPITIIDSNDGGPYALLSSIQAGTYAEGDEAIMSFAMYNSPGSTGALTVTCCFGPNCNPQDSSGTSQWLGVVALEIANVGPSPLLASVGKEIVGVPDTLPTMTLSSNALVVAISEMVSGTVAPDAGAGFTPLADIWAWAASDETTGLPSALIEYQLSAAGNVAATFVEAPSS